MSTENLNEFSPAPVEGAAPPALKPPEKLHKRMPTSLEELGKLNITIAAAKHTIGLNVDNEEYKTKSDEGVESEEVVEQEAKMMARARMTSEKEDREKGLLKTGVANWWKYGVHSLGTYIKEKDQAQRIMAESGLQMQSLPYEFVRQIRQTAQEAVDNDRTTEDDERETKKLQRKGRRRDFFNAARMHQKDLDRKEVEIMHSLRQTVTPGLPSAEQDEARQFALDNGTLVESYKKVLNGDFQASEGLAERLGDEFGDDAIRTAVGETRAQNIEMKGPMAVFFKNDVIKPLLIRGMANNGDLDDDTLLEKRTLIQEKFFTKDFVDWRNGLSQGERNALDLSMSYGTNVIPAVQDMLKNLVQIQDTLKSDGQIEEFVNKLVLNVNVGTLKAGEQGGVDESWKEDKLSRSIKNREVYNLYQSISEDDGPESAVPGAYQMALDSASGRALLVPRGGHVTAGLITGAAIYAAQSGLRFGGNLVAPIIGGSAVGGVVRAGQEHSRFTREVEQHRREVARGVTFDEDDKRREKMSELELPTVDIHTDVLAPLEEVKRKFEDGTVDKGVLDSTLGLLANTRASRSIMDTDQNIELYETSTNNSLDAQKTKLELLRAQTRVQLNAYAAEHPAETREYLKERGLIDAAEDDNPFMKAEAELSSALQANLIGGSEIDESLEAILGDFAIDKEGSIDSRERAARSARRWSMFKQGGGTFAAGAIGGFASHYASGAIMSGAHSLAERASNSPTVQRLFGWKPPDGNVDTQKGFHPKGTIPSKIGGKIVTIPEGTTWHPNGNNTYDLVIVGHPDQVLANDVTFKGDKLVFNKEGSLITEKDVTETPHKVSKAHWVPPKEVTKSKDIDVDKSWNRHATHIDERAWYSNDTDVSDGNETRFHTLKHGKTILLQMQGTGMSHASNVDPSKLDVQQLIHDKKAQFSFNLAGDKEPMVVNANSVTKDHDGRWLATLKLNPSDTNPDHVVTFANGEKMQLGELSKMLINQQAASKIPDGDFASEMHTDYRNVFRLGGPDGKGRGQISAGRLLHRNGHNVWQSIATIFGDGKTPDTIHTEVVSSSPGKYVNTDSSLYEIRVDIPDKTIDKPGEGNTDTIRFGSNPFRHKPWEGADIAFPLPWPRKPLEAGQDSEGPRTEPISLIRTSPPEGTVPVTPLAPTPEQRPVRDETSPVPAASEADQPLNITKTHAALENELLKDSRFTTKDVTSGAVKLKDDVQKEIGDYVQDAAKRRMSQEEVVEQFKSFYEYLGTKDLEDMTSENENINKADEALIAERIRKNVNEHFGILPEDVDEIAVQVITSYINKKNPNLLHEPAADDKIADLAWLFGILAPDIDEEEKDLAKTKVA